MIRLFHTYFPTRTVVLGISETLLIAFAFVSAMVLSFGLQDANLILQYESGLLKIILVAGIFALCMYYFDLYDALVIANNREATIRLLQVIGCGLVIFGALYYFYPSLGISQKAFLRGAVVAAILLIASRYLFLTLNRSKRFSEPTVIFGEGPLASDLSQRITERSELGLRLVGYLNPAPAPEEGFSHLPYLGPPECLEEMCAREKVQRIIVTLGDRRGNLPVEDLLRLKTQGIQIQDGSEFYESITGRLPLRSLRLSWLLFSDGFRPSRYLLFYKRLFSFVVSVIGLVLAAPAMLIAAVCICLESPGGAIFKQVRIGKDGKPFTVFKFRSMYLNADQGLDEVPAQAADGRITKVGKWLRRSRIDELPQLFNILKGDMYFVGPRPFVPSQERELAQQIPFYRQRWSVKPGATGWAQVNRGYNATIAENTEKLEYDLFYIKNMSIMLDLFILFRTAKILLLGRGGR